MTVFQVVPFYLDDDEEVGRYFKERRQEIDAVTGPNVIVISHTAIADGHASSIVDALNSGRFGNVTVDKLPCLYIEGGGNSFVHLLPNHVEGVKRALRVISAAAVTAKSTATLKEALVTQLEKPEAVRQEKHEASTSVPAWFPVAGYVTLAITLLFLMAIYLYSVMVHPIQQDDGVRMILVFVVSLALAMGASFIGGNAVANGQLPFFENALRVSFAGGVAIWFVSMLIGYELFAKGSNRVEATHADAPAAVPAIQIGAGARIEDTSINSGTGAPPAQASASEGRQRALADPSDNR